jgi:flavin-dependent dehydrogenase
MLERDPQPRHAVCGEFLLEAQAELARLGVDLDQHGASRITALRLVHGPVVAEADLPFVGRGLSRKILDEALRREAVRAGARLVRGAPVRSFTARPAAISLEAGRLGEIWASTVFLATGKHDIRGVKRLDGRASDDFIAFKI